MTKKEKTFYVQPVIYHQNSIVHRSKTECLVLTLACLQQNTEHTPHKCTELHDMILSLTSNTLLIPALLEVLFHKESSKGSPHPKGEKTPTKTNIQNYNKTTSKET